MDVPESTMYEPSGTGYVDKIFPPGAPNDGLASMSYVGPYDEKSEMRPPVTDGTFTAAPVCGNVIWMLAPEAYCLTSCTTIR